MIRQFIICFVVLNIIAANLFALGDFVQQHETHQNGFYSPHAHEHRHVHQNAEHKHGHAHKAGFVDFFIADIIGPGTLLCVREKNFMVKQWHPEPVSSELFRPPIA